MSLTQEFLLNAELNDTTDFKVEVDNFYIQQIQSKQRMYDYLKIQNKRLTLFIITLYSSDKQRIFSNFNVSFRLKYRANKFKIAPIILTRVKGIFIIWDGFLCSFFLCSNSFGDPAKIEPSYPARLNQGIYFRHPFKVESKFFVISMISPQSKLT